MNRYLLIALSALILAMPGLILSGGCSPPAPDLKPKAAIIDQLYMLRPNQAFIDKTTEILEAYGFRIDIYQGKEVTVDFYRKLAKHSYKLIIFRVHSGILSRGQGSELETAEGTWLFTAEAYSKVKYVREQLTEQLEMAKIDENHPWVFAIGSKFISQNMKGRFPNTVIIMMGCFSAYRNDMAQAFCQKGASTYLGRHNTVDLSYVDEATVSLIQKLDAEQLTVRKAVTQTMAEKGSDPTWGAVLRYYPVESGSHTIGELINKGTLLE